MSHVGGPVRTRLPRINGKRGRYLLFKSAVFLLIGLTYTVPAPSSGTSRSLAWLIALGLPVWFAGLPWLAAALVGVMGAFRRPPSSDSWAFATLAAVASVWVAIYLLGWIFGSSPRGYFLALIFAALAGATLTVSGMMDARHVSDGIRGRVDRAERGEL